MPERLVSRFTSGLVADIQVPQLETRVAIVRKKAELESIPLSDEVAVLLAQNIQSNVRELEGALIRLAAKSSLTGRPIDEEFTLSEMNTVSPRRADVMSVEDIQRAVCSHFRLSNSELLSKDRHKSVAFARQVAMYLCRQRLKCSFPELGRAFGNRDHTTVMSAVRRVEALRQRDPQVNAHLEAIEQRLASSESWASTPRSAALCRVRECGALCDESTQTPLRGRGDARDNGGVRVRYEPRLCERDAARTRSNPAAHRQRGQVVDRAARARHAARSNPAARQRRTSAVHRGARLRSAAWQP